MSEEEKKAIEEIKNWRDYIIKNKEKVNRANDIEFYLRTVLNLIEKQSKEIEHIKNLNEHQNKDMTKAVNYTFELNKEINIKDNVIDEMAKEINKITSEKYKIKHVCEKGKCRNEECHEDNWNNCIKEYFRKKAEVNE